MTTEEVDWETKRTKRRQVDAALQLYREGRLQEALIIIEGVIVDDPYKSYRLSCDSRHIRATILHRLGYEGAFRALELVAEGDACHHAGDFEDAIKRYRVAISLDPTCLDAMSRVAFVLATACKAEYQNGVAARVYAQAACQRSGWRNPFYIKILAAAHARCGQFSEAVRMQQMIMATVPAALQAFEEAILNKYLSGQAYVHYPDGAQVLRESGSNADRTLQ